MSSCAAKEAKSVKRNNPCPLKLRTRLNQMLHAFDACGDSENTETIKPKRCDEYLCPSGFVGDQLAVKTAFSKSGRITGMVARSGSKRNRREYDGEFQGKNHGRAAHPNPIVV